MKSLILACFMLTLNPCPESPNCVCSCTSHDDSHFVEAIPFGADPDVMTTLIDAVQQLPRTTIVKQEDKYLHAECRSFLFRFVDDLECLIDQEAKIIHVRSASRVGYSDLGVNRKRVEKLRALMQAH